MARVLGPTHQTSPARTRPSVTVKLTPSSSQHINSSVHFKTSYSLLLSQIRTANSFFCNSQTITTMSGDLCTQRPLFGGAIVSNFPLRFEDVSNIRQVPDNQEVFVDPARDESLIFELLELKADVADHGSATWFLQDLASEQDAEGTMVLEQSGVFEADGLRFGNNPAIITTAVGQMAISKGRQGRDAQNIVKVYLANLRLKGVATDVLVTAYEPMLINPLSETAAAVGAGLAVPAAQSGRLPMAEVFKSAVSSFKVNDWSLFGAVA